MSFEKLPDRVRFFIHPLPLLSVAVMALNDHWLKYRYGGLITGKLSDFCGVFYFPIFLLALVAATDELLDKNRFILNSTSAISAILFTDFLMLLVKLSPASSKLIEVFFSKHFFPIQLTPDPTDLVSFIVNPLSYFFLRAYWTNSNET